MHRSIAQVPAFVGGHGYRPDRDGWSGTAHAQEPSPKPSALIVPINGTVRLQMSTKKPIKTVTNPKDTAINIRTVVGDPTTVLIIGQQPDVTRIELEDVDGKKETYEVIVQADVEYLRTQLRRAVPTANVTPIPTSNNAVILTGTVTRAEDVDHHPRRGPERRLHSHQRHARRRRAAGAAGRGRRPGVALGLPQHGLQLPGRLEATSSSAARSARPSPTRPWSASAAASLTHRRPVAQRRARRAQRPADQPPRSACCTTAGASSASCRPCGTRAWPSCWPSRGW